jgi:nitrate reductase alpha subunit
MRQKNWPSGAERKAGSSSDPQHTELAPLLPRGEPVESLLRKAQFFTQGTVSDDYRSEGPHRLGERLGDGGQRCG